MFPLPTADPCPFCEYVAGRAVRMPHAGELIPCAVVEELDQTLAFVNTIRPLGYPADGSPTPWVIVVPKRRAPTLVELTAAEAAAMMLYAHRLVAAIASGFTIDGLRLLQNNGLAGDQTVPHAHLHLIPCLAGGPQGLDGLRQSGALVPFGESQRIAACIRAQLTPQRP